jgi:hypothetical protein
MQPYLGPEGDHLQVSQLRRPASFFFYIALTPEPSASAALSPPRKAWAP